jgi:hypothetical protein
MTRRSYAEILTHRALSRRPLPPELARQLRHAGLEPLPRALVDVLAVGARVAEGVDPRLAWQSIRELTDQLTSAQTTGAGIASVRSELLELTDRARYDRVRRALEHLVELDIVRRSPVNAEPRPRVLVFNLAPFDARW